MSDPQKTREARAKLEEALQEYVRLTRDEIDHVFVQDYVICVASESMDPGHENITYLNNINRPSMPIYAVIGLLNSTLDFYRRSQARGIE